MAQMDLFGAAKPTGDNDEYLKLVDELTPLGVSLLPVQRFIKAWAEDNIEKVHAARLRYDADS